MRKRNKGKKELHFCNLATQLHVLLRPFVHSCTATCTSIICFSGSCGCNPAVVDAHK